MLVAFLGLSVSPPAHDRVYSLSTPDSLLPASTDGISRWQGRQAVLEHEADYGTLTNSTECKGRMLAYEYALKLQPARAPLLDVFDALFGTSHGDYQCNVSRPAAVGPAWPLSAADSPPLPAVSFYIDAEKGDDGAAGTLAAPFESVARGVAASRAVPAAAERGVVLRAGIHYLNAPVALDARDSGLTLTNYPGEEVWLSGASGGPLTPEWRPYNTSNASAPAVPCAEACAAAGHCCVGDVSSFNQPSCGFGCTFGAPGGAYASSEEQCRSLCDAAVSANCKYEAPFRNGSGTHEFQMCGGCPKGCSSADGVDECYQGCMFAFNHGHAGANLFVTDIDERLAGVTGLFTVSPHARLTRARFPNANPEDRSSVHTLPTLHYMAPPVVPPALQTFKNLSALGLKNDSTLAAFNAYSSGTCAGGAGDPNCPCGIWMDVRDGVWSSESYWCGNVTAGGW